MHVPRLPLEGSLDLTYRCNNHCRHCWLWRPNCADEVKRELSFDEWRGIIDQARALGTRKWNLSGGEPMLRPDFPEIFEFVTGKCLAYTLNTNGTLITPAIARQLTRPGTKLVALYGATAEVYDHVARHPGGFEAAMQGIAYLREAGASFVVQLVPMRDNFHQWQEMIELAQSLSPQYRVGASWLFMSASGDPVVNAEIARQRLDPEMVIALDTPLPTGGNLSSSASCAVCDQGDDRLFAQCIAGMQEFHVDVEGGLSFCGSVKNPALRYDLRRGTLREGWEVFIPALAASVRGGDDYLQGCGQCDRRAVCLWCPVYGYLEHRRLAAPVDYLCRVADATRQFQQAWTAEHQRYYQIAGITIQVESPLPITDDTFERKFQPFRVDGPGEDTITFRHHYPFPELRPERFGEEVYRNAPWAIYHRDGGWTYLGIQRPEVSDQSLHLVMTANEDHSLVDIYHPDIDALQQCNYHSLSMTITDQILLAPALPARDACYLHAAGAVLDGQGLLFLGHSSAGKTTTTRMLESRAEILCDDRIIVRRWPEGFRVHGTWHHGESPLVSSAEAPLHSILFLEQATENSLTELTDRGEIVRQLLPRVVTPLATVDWWDRVLALLQRLIAEVPCYRMRFDLSGDIISLLPPARK